MRSHAIVTIVTTSHLHYAHAMHDSIEAFDSTIEFVALVIDPSHEPLPAWAITMEQLSGQPRALQLAELYSPQDYPDYLRWSLKSQMVLFCLLRGASAVCWVDPDVMFFRSPKSLLDSIQPKQVLLSPHYRAFRPSTDEINFGKNYTEGLFQAGFVGFGKGSEPVLDWWAEACLWKMAKDAMQGAYVDQRFLDMIPVIWEDAVILRHRGCNLAEWNWHECSRSITNGEVVIDGKYPVFFIHFTDCTIADILRGRDSLLRPYLDSYVHQLTKIVPSFRLRGIDAVPSIPQPKLKSRWWIASMLLRWIWRRFK